MENLTNVLAAFDAGKLPSQQQINQFIDFTKAHVIAQTKEATGGSALSPQGEALAKHIGAVLDAYKALGSNKNGDDILQDALWHLSQGDVAASSPDVSMEGDLDEATKDLKAVQKSLRELITIVWTSISSESSELFRDFSSFARLALADAAEVVEGQASRAKSSLREVEGEVQDGQRDTLGRDKQRLEEEEDVKVAFAHGMDTAKGAGVSAIGTVQDASATAEDVAERTSARFQNAFTKICERAQNDKDYHDSINVMVNIAEKWLTRSEDAAKSADFDNLIYDPTPEQHVTKALKGLQTFVERLAGNKSLDSLYSKGRACAVHIQNDQNLQTWFHDFFKVIRRTLDESGYTNSDDYKKTRKDLRVRWKKFFVDDSQWKKDWDAFKTELASFEDALAQDKDLNRVREAHSQLGQSLEKGLSEGAEQAKSGLQAAMDQASWFWRDIFQVYVPRALSFMKDVPIPRTEYVDEDMELVLENLDISSFNINPAHVFIRNITDIDIQTTDTSAPGKTLVGTLTHIHVQAVQLALDEVSFFYKDKRASLGPSDFSGLVTFTLPPQGIDIDVKLRLIPADQTTQLTSGGKTFTTNQRELHHAFHVVESAQAEISSDIELTIKESNHSMLLSVFKPIFTMRFREALERTLSEQIKATIEWADHLAWDVSERSEVFKDSGLGAGGALAGAVWSEFGKMRRMSSGGWSASGTGTGLVVEGEGKQAPAFAMGAEPQILSGDKKGPKGTASVPLSERLQDVTGMDVDNADDATESAKQTGEQLKQATTNLKQEAEGAIKQGKRELQSFKQSVEAKSERERQQEGWRSSAFDV